MTALTVYTITTNSPTLSTAKEMINTSGGAQGAGINTLIDNSTGWGEVFSQGDASNQFGQGSQGSPSGHGCIFESTALEGNTISAGNWTPTVSMKTSVSGTVSCDIVHRFYKRSSGGSYTLIGSITHASQSITNVTTAYTPSAASLSSMAFATGDKLYWDLWLHASANTCAAGANIAWRPSNSTTLGWTGSQIVTPGYSATGGSATHLLICDGYGGVFS